MARSRNALDLTSPSSSASHTVTHAAPRVNSSNITPLGGAPSDSPPRCALAPPLPRRSPPALACITPLGGAPSDSPPRCALAPPLPRRSPPALACITPLGGAPSDSPPRCGLAPPLPRRSPPALACPRYFISQAR